MNATSPIRSLARSMFILAALAGSVGCGGAEVSRVTGGVILDGTPLPEATVVFRPESNPHLGLMVQELTAEDGTFDIRPIEEQGQGRPGEYVVIVGDYAMKGAVLAMAMSGASDLQLPNGKRLAPLRYWMQESTPLRATIVRGVNELEPFELETDGKPFFSK